MKQLINIISEELNNKDGLLFPKLIAVILVPVAIIMVVGVVLYYISGFVHSIFS